MNGAFEFNAYNGSVIPLGEIPTPAFDVFSNVIVESISNGARISALFAEPSGDERFRLYAVLSHDEDGILSVLSTTVGRRYPALTPNLPQAHWFEREIAEEHGLVPEGHPWLKPIRFQHTPKPDAQGKSEHPAIGLTDFYRVEGAEIHEVAVGPVHAGVIEPGHFRFQCHGETVQHLEISLGYQHRGVKRALIGGPDKRSIHYMETLAGDTSVGHATAYSQLIESLSGIETTPRAQSLRAIALELERMANHVGDLGALANDVGFLPTAAYCGRLRGDFLNMTAMLCGNRFGRGFLQPGGVAFDLDERLVNLLRERLNKAMKDVESALSLLWETPSVRARFENTGTVSSETAEKIGLVGVPARASGLALDIRKDHPGGIYRFFHIPAQTCDTGDVFARAHVRWLEIESSATFIREQLSELPEGALMAQEGPLAKNSLVLSLVEGWRGEIAHSALTDAEGKFSLYQVTDPSFHNWFGLAMAMRNQQISDFPLCNKSFNLSYCGHDL